MHACRRLTVSLLIVKSVLAQPADTSPRFAAVTIKGASPDASALAQSFFGRASWWGGRCAEDGSHRSNSVPDSLESNCAVSFANLLGHAYHLNSAQFTADQWMESTWFRIQAKAPPGATEDQFRLMERSLLADRFKLSAHFVKQEVSAYEMTVTRGGPKFLSAPQKPPFAGIRLATQSSAAGMSVLLKETISMDQLASYLSFFLNAPAVDATGLPGLYDINLKFGARLRDGDAPIDGPPLVEAVRDQLGLVLERTKIVTDVLVIDHVEKKPTPQ